MVIVGVAAGSDQESKEVEQAILNRVQTSQDELDALRDGLQGRLAALHREQDTYESAVKKHDKLLRNVALKFGAHAGSKLNGLQARLGEKQALMPARGGMFVELFLGGINVRFARKSERLAFKKEYEMLKLKLAPMFVGMCVVCLVLEDYRWLHMILQLALSCYYVALAVRENILRVNGSNIRAWWIIHHYLTMMQGVVLLTWPSGASYACYRRRLHVFGLYNSVLMIFQTRYQMSRLYTLRSLGMAGEMEVASSDSTQQIHWSETMTLLLPLVVLGQAMQGYLAAYLLRLYRRFPNELQILLLSILFLANFVGNSMTTVQVLVAKRRERQAKAARRQRGHDKSQ